MYLRLIAIVMLLGLSMCFLSWNFDRIQLLKLENNFLEDLLSDLKKTENQESVPSMEYELTQFRTRRDVNEFWDFLRSRHRYLKQ
jgi:hypothetical protein